MKVAPQTPAPPESPSSKADAERQGSGRLPLPMVVALALLALLFAKPLFHLASFSWGSDIYSHILLIPFITVYLLRDSKINLQFVTRPSLKLGWVPGLAGALLLVLYWNLRVTGRSIAQEDALFLLTFSFVLFTWGLFACFVSTQTLQRSALPLVLLLFLAPFPSVVLEAIVTFFQQGSAHVAEWLLALSGMPLVREGTHFRLPGFNMQVAPECSGIRSTLVLFIVSLVAGQLLLRSPSKRAMLALAVVPLALLRNGFRIFVIGQLCVNVSPAMIDSPIHHKGGPIFFALSLIPFFFLILWLRRRERKKL